MKTNLFFVCFWIFYSSSFASKEGHHRHNKIASNDHESTTLVTKNELFKGKEIFLQITHVMRNQSATSGGKFQLKCKIDGWPKKNIQFSWFKDDALIDMTRDPRVTITTRPWGSRLRVKDLFTLDTGVYRCEASNGFRKVESSASLKVSFEITNKMQSLSSPGHERPPPPSEQEKSFVNFPSGKCEKYRGLVCGDYLSNVHVFVDSFENQEEMEDEMKQALSKISNTSFSSESCQKYTLPAFCHFVFTPCRIDTNGDIKRGKRLCREDCHLLKSNVCHTEFLERNKNPFLEVLFNSANCSQLPSVKDSNCVRIGVTGSRADTECYADDGADYRGSVNVAVTGEKCQPWPRFMSAEHFELLGGHNFCRNPKNILEKPWCYVDDEKTTMVNCNITPCEQSYTMARNLVILIASVSVFVLFIFIIVICCIQSSKRTQTPTPASFTRVSSDNQHDAVLLPTQKKFAPARIDFKSIQLLVEIGKGEYGKICKGTISNDPRFSEKQPFAFKIFEFNPLTSKLELFKREMEELSKLCHPNITNLKAIASDQTIKVLGFEYTNQVDLHEYLMQNSPTSDYSKSQLHSVNDVAKLNSGSFLKMAQQIASGMEYLSMNNHIHQDLAARNVLVCENMQLKICTLGMLKDSCLSCYHKLSDGQLIPIRWMAPEYLQHGQFSDKSPIWSFGVLLWEIFSYGMQPYCGYSNHEVLEVISRRQLLSCPDQCPAKIYSLMHECWAAQPEQRPAFSEIRRKIEIFQNTNNHLQFNTLPFSRDAYSNQPPRYYSAQSGLSCESSNNYSESTQLL